MECITGETEISNCTNYFDLHGAKNRTNTKWSESSAIGEYGGIPFAGIFLVSVFCCEKLRKQIIMSLKVMKIIQKKNTIKRMKSL